MICTTFSRSQQVIIIIATIEWFGWWEGHLFSLKKLLYFLFSFMVTNFHDLKVAGINKCDNESHVKIIKFTVNWSEKQIW